MDFDALSDDLARPFGFLPLATLMAVVRSWRYRWPVTRVTCGCMLWSRAATSARVARRSRLRVRPRQTKPRVENASTWPRSSPEGAQQQN